MRKAIFLLRYHVHDSASWVEKLPRIEIWRQLDLLKEQRALERQQADAATKKAGAGVPSSKPPRRGRWG